MRGQGQEPREAGLGLGGNQASMLEGGWGSWVSGARAPVGGLSGGREPSVGGRGDQKGSSWSGGDPGCRMGWQRWGEGTRHLMWGAGYREKCG